MAAPISYQRDLQFEYGKLAPVSPTVRRLICRNPSPFTFYGTGTLVVGHTRVVVVDPGPAMPDHIDSLLSNLGDERVEAIVITHTHPDHSPGAALLKKRTGAKTYGFGRHGEGVPGSNLRDGGDHREQAGADLDFVPDRRIACGDVLEVGSTRLNAIHTPGHCHNHLCFAVDEGPTQGTSLLTGDHIMGWSTSIVSPPDGDMGDYFSSLRKTLARNDAQLIPAHGPTITTPKPFIQSLIEHRQARELQIEQCLKDGIAHIPDVVKVMYKAVPTILHPAAERSVLAHALHLQKQGKVRCDQDGAVDNTWHCI